MIKLATLALLGATAIALPAFAADVNSDAQDVQSDVHAVNKDNANISHNQADINRNRAAKAQDKATNSYGSEAVDSAKIGYDKTAKAGNGVSKSIDQTKLQHHQKQLDQDANKAEQQ